MSPRVSLCVLTLPVLLVLANCAKDGSSELANIPAVAPIAAAALPTSLKSSSRSSFLAGRPAPADASLVSPFTSFFKGSFGKLSGGNGVGYVNSLLEDMDSRFTELKSRFSTTTPTCFSGTAQSYSLDLSAADTVNTDSLKLAMDIQCYDLFTSTNPGEQSGTGSGMLFGRNGSNYSLMLLLNNKTTANSTFGYAATVTNKDLEDETVDILFGEANQATNSRVTLSRIRAKRKTGSYEFAIASNSTSASNPISGTANQMGCGLRGITNGTLIYAGGNYVEAGTCAAPTGNSGTFEMCLNASDLSDAGDAACNTLKTQFTIGTPANLSNFNSTVVAAADNDTIYNALQINTEAVKAKATSVK